MTSSQTTHEFGDENECMLISALNQLTLNATLPSSPLKPSNRENILKSQQSMEILKVGVFLP